MVEKFAIGLQENGIGFDGIHIIDDELYIFISILSILLKKFFELCIR
jgi:hypothetical protein